MPCPVIAPHSPVCPDSSPGAVVAELKFGPFEGL